MSKIISRKGAKTQRKYKCFQQSHVIPAQAGIQWQTKACQNKLAMMGKSGRCFYYVGNRMDWIPACAGMTKILNYDKNSLRLGVFARNLC
jgi:hypothetical protein